MTRRVGLGTTNGTVAVVDITSLQGVPDDLLERTGIPVHPDALDQLDEWKVNYADDDDGVGIDAP